MDFDGESHVVRLLLEYMDGGDLYGLIEGRREASASGPFDAHFARRLLAYLSLSSLIWLNKLTNRFF